MRFAHDTHKVKVKCKMKMKMVKTKVRHEGAIQKPDDTWKVSCVFVWHTEREDANQDEYEDGEDEDGK